MVDKVKLAAWVRCATCARKKPDETLVNAMLDGEVPEDHQTLARLRLEKHLLNLESSQ